MKKQKASIPTIDERPAGTRAFGPALPFQGDGFIPPTTEETANLIAQALLRTKNPVIFAEAWLDIRPHEGQRKWLLAPKPHLAVLVAGRRFGKSMCTAIDALYFALTHPNSKQAIISVTLDQAQTVFNYINDFITQNELLKIFVAKVRQQPFPTIYFKNDSFITTRAAARQGLYLRSHGFDRVYADEAEYLSESILVEVVSMTLADRGGQLFLTTTPKHVRGYVYRLLERGLSGDPSVYAQTGTTFDNPYINREFVESLRDQMPAVVWQREVEGKYVDDTESVFRFEDIQAAYDDVGWDVPEAPVAGRRYVQGVDLAKTNDHTVHIILDVTERPYRVVFFERYQRVPWPAVSARIRELHNRYQCRQTLVDATGVGSAVMDELADIAKPFVFTAKSKVELITSIQVALEKRHLRFPFIRVLVDELHSYRYKDDDISTDTVMALGLALRAAGQVAYDKLIIRTVEWPSIPRRHHPAEAPWASGAAC